MADPEQPAKHGESAGNQGGGSLGDLVKAESMIQLAITLPLACVLGWVIGEALDKHFHQGWMGVTGILVGAVAGFLQIFRMASGYLKKNGE